MSEIEIRLYHDGDEAAVIGLWQACGLVTPWNHPRADIARKCADSADLFFVGLAENRVIASCMAGYDGHRGWIYYLAVAADWRRSGVARAMIAHAEDRLRERGCPKIDLMVRQKNREVIAFYHAIGYTDDPVTVLSKRLIEDDEHDFTAAPLDIPSPEY